MVVRLITILHIVYLSACSNPNVFGKKTLHDSYSDKIIKAGLAETTLGRAWIDQAEQAVTQPQSITVPYKEKGYFLAGKPRAYGLKFSTNRGHKLHFSVEKAPLKDFDLFIDVWKSNKYEVKHIKFIDSTQTEFDIEAEEDGEFIIRLQPELLKDGNYTLSISVGPSLVSPVAGNKGRIASIWGDSRDGGARLHEGVDLFAPFKTPAVAAADGIITRVNENRLGGKVVWLRPKGKNLSLYYAHLDQQLVNEGDQVRVGDTIGLIGNTGNAQSTPSHLHFGIYAAGGAIDPFPFINQRVKKPANLTTKSFGRLLRIKRSVSVNENDQSLEINQNTPIWYVGHSANEVKVEAPLGNVISVPFNFVEEATAVSRVVSSRKSYLFATPSINALEIGAIRPSDTFQVYGYYNKFALVAIRDSTIGWLPTSDP